jgi:hypothetical protein
MKNSIWAALIAAFAGCMAPAMAQQTPAPVFYVFADDREGWRADKAIQGVLAGPDFQVRKKRDPDALVVARSGAVELDPGESAVKHFRFTLEFFRDGGKLGESKEECRSDKMADCADQIAQDITGAAAIHN